LRHKLLVQIDQGSSRGAVGVDVPEKTSMRLLTMVIYELHIGTFNNTFAGAVGKLDYLKNPDSPGFSGKIPTP
jgi:1,4-alpha-glucan branching enzyme